MKQVLALIMAAGVTGAAIAQETVAVAEGEVAAKPVNKVLDEIAESEEEPVGIGPFDAAAVTLEEFQWVNRPIVVFADTPADPRYQQQIALLLDRLEELAERDVVIIVDTDPANASDIRTKLRPRGFQLTLIGKDGGVKLRKPLPWDVREISRVIDKMPMRQQEIRDRVLRE